MVPTVSFLLASMASNSADEKSRRGRTPLGIRPRRLTRQRALHFNWSALHLVVRRLPIAERTKFPVSAIILRCGVGKTMPAAFSDPTSRPVGIERRYASRSRMGRLFGVGHGWSWLTPATSLYTHAMACSQDLVRAFNESIPRFSPRVGVSFFFLHVVRRCKGTPLGVNRN